MYVYRARNGMERFVGVNPGENDSSSNNAIVNDIRSSNVLGSLKYTQRFAFSASSLTVPDERK